MTTVAERRRRKRANANAVRKAQAERTPEQTILRAIRSVAAQNAPGRHSSLYRLHRDNSITAVQYEAGCHLRDDELDSRDSGVAGWQRESRGTGGFPDQRLARQAASLADYHRAQQSLLEAGVAPYSVALNVCIGDFEPKELARRALGEEISSGLNNALAAKTKVVLIALRLGLDALAKHYGSR